MSDKEKAAREALEEYFQRTEWDGIVNNLFILAFLTGAEWAEKSKWIRCAERLPEPYKPVLLVVGGKRLIKIGQFDSECHDWEIDGIGSIAITSPSHWQYVPEAPKEEG